MEKYESLRDVDSPVKEVSQLKKLLKNNDINTENQKKEIEDFKIKFTEIKNEKEDLERNYLKLQEEQAKETHEFTEIKEKYESLRDIDSPVKEVSQIRKLLKQSEERNKHCQER